jgi:hypothetical protein
MHYFKAIIYSSKEVFSLRLGPVNKARNKGWDPHHDETIMAKNRFYLYTQRFNIISENLKF